MHKEDWKAPAFIWGLLVVLFLTVLSQACSAPKEGEASVVDESRDAVVAEANDAGAQTPSRLAVLWTSGDPEVAPRWLSCIPSMPRGRGGSMR